MEPSVRRLTPERQRQLTALGRSSAPVPVLNPYRHEDAMGRLLERDGSSIAVTLGLARRTVNQWRERYDSEHRGPGVVLSLAIRRALELGRSLDDALAPLDAILEEHGQIRCAKVDCEHTVIEISEHAVRTASAAANACLAAVEAAKGGHAERCHREVHTAIASLHELEQMVAVGVAAAG